MKRLPLSQFPVKEALGRRYRGDEMHVQCTGMVTDYELNGGYVTFKDGKKDVCGFHVDGEGGWWEEGADIRLKISGGHWTFYGSSNK